MSILNLRNFKPVIIANLLIIVPSMFVMIISYYIPNLVNSLSASLENFPWGIFTSIFAHWDLPHFSENMMTLVLMSGVFILIHWHSPEIQINRRAKFFLLNIFVSSFFTNIFWIIIAPTYLVAGASTAVFVTMGMIVGFALKTLVFFICVKYFQRE